MSAAAVQLDDENLPAEYPLFPVGVTKLVVMSVATFGLYEIYWFYQNWRRLKSTEGLDVWPVPRAIFAGITSFSLFGKIQERAAREHISTTWSASTLGIAFLLLNIAARLPDPYWLVCFASFLPLLAVQPTVDAINARSRSSEGPNTKFSGGNIAGIVVGGLLFALVILGMMMPDKPQ